MRAQEELWRGNCAAAALARVSRASRRMVRVWSNTGAGTSSRGQSSTLQSSRVMCSLVSHLVSHKYQVIFH